MARVSVSCRWSVIRLGRFPMCSHPGPPPTPRTDRQLIAVIVHYKPHKQTNNKKRKENKEIAGVECTNRSPSPNNDSIDAVCDESVRLWIWGEMDICNTDRYYYLSILLCKKCSPCSRHIYTTTLYNNSTKYKIRYAFYLRESLVNISQNVNSESLLRH